MSGVPLGVYGESSQPHPRQILNDIKTLARWILSNKHYQTLYRHAPSPGVDLLVGEPAESLQLQPSALQTAVAITTAMDLLASPNISTLASNFGQLMDARHDSGASITIAGRQALTFPVRSAHDRALAAVHVRATTTGQHAPATASAPTRADTKRGVRKSAPVC
jgi:hypothetical protein